MNTQERMKLLETVMIIATAIAFAVLYKDRTEAEKKLTPTEFIEKTINDFKEYC